MTVLLCYLISVNQVNINLILKNQYQVVQHSLQVNLKKIKKTNFRRKCLANIQFNERHYNEVIRVLPLRTSR